MLPADLVKFIQSRAFSLSSEKALQESISAELVKAGIPHVREARLSQGDVVDFLFPGGLAAECKLSGQKRAIYRQCERYCAHEAVTGLVLVTNAAMGMPPEIKGKPCWVASLGRGWLHA